MTLSLDISVGEVILGVLQTGRQIDDLVRSLVVDNLGDPLCYQWVVTDGQRMFPVQSLDESCIEARCELAIADGAERMSSPVSLSLQIQSTDGLLPGSHAAVILQQFVRDESIAYAANLLGGQERTLFIYDLVGNTLQAPNWPMSPLSREHFLSEEADRGELVAATDVLFANAGLEGSFAKILDEDPSGMGL